MVQVKRSGLTCRMSGMASDDLRPFRGCVIGVALSVLLWMLICGVWTAWGADGLPSDAPDLYDPAIVASFERVSHTPFQDVPNPCTVTILRTDGWAEDDRGNKHPLIFLVSYLTDPLNGRIVFLLQTFLHVDGTSQRSYRAWIDTGYDSGKPATGEWTDLSGGITHPMLLDEARGYIAGIYARVATAHARRHGQ